MAISPWDSTEFDYVPGYTKPTHVYGQEWGTAAEQDQFLAPIVRELLKSMVAPRQRGVTLAGGQGILPTGCILAQQTANGLYYLHNPSASDGTQNAIGILRDARDTGGTGDPSGKVATNAMGNLVWSGAVDASLLSGQDTTSLTGWGMGIGSAAAGAYGADSQLRYGRYDPTVGYFIF